MVEHPEHHREQQREQLSALLDNELDEHERNELEAHLRDCAVCRTELADLQRTKALLHHLPPPVLPRSFILPPEVQSTTEPETPPTHQRSPVSARRPTSQPHIRSARPRRPIQVLHWLSVAAAVLGLVFLLSSAFSTRPLPGISTTSNQDAKISQPGASTSGGTAARPSSTPPTTTMPHTGTPIGVERTPRPTSSPKVEQSRPSGEATGSPPASTLQPFITTTGLGLLLLILGACGFAIARILRHRG